MTEGQCAPLALPGGTKTLCGLLNARLSDNKQLGLLASNS